MCTGALTNAALLLSVYPELADVLRVVLMGGAMGAGNTGAVAEFNIQLDPEAASIVFNSGADVTMVPLEVTHTALVTPEVLARIRGDGASRFRRVVGELLTFFAASYERVFGFTSPPLHDPCAVAAAFALLAVTLVLNAGGFLFYALVTGTKILAPLVLAAMILPSGLLGFCRSQRG